MRRAGVGHVQVSFVRVEGEAVGADEIISHHTDRARGADPVDPVGADLMQSDRKAL
jgi:hypothetical protein